MSVYAVENLPRKWYTGDVLINNKGIAVYFAISSQKGAKLFCPALFFKAEKFCFKSEAGDKDGI